MQTMEPQLEDSEWNAMFAALRAGIDDCQPREVAQPKYDLMDVKDVQVGELGVWLPKGPD